VTVAASLSTVRCALTARARADELLATAPPARRFFLLEIPGPWLPDALAAAGLEPSVAATLRTSVAAVGARLLLIRRPGRHPLEPDRPRLWGIAQLHGKPGEMSVGGLTWGEWRTADELLDVDPGRPVPPFQVRTQHPLALVCTHGRHDLCCAIEGRAVAAAAAADPRADVWECSHLGGDRFAGNLLWLPSGLLFGGLSAETTRPILDAAHEGRVVLEHFRGRCGDPQAAQAAQWHLMRALGEHHADEVVVEHFTIEHSEPTGESHVVAVVRHRAARYRVELALGWSEPQHLTCRARADTRARTYRLTAPPALL
jgi:hypothetical protein